jgi:hypothetical protein
MIKEMLINKKEKGITKIKEKESKRNIKNESAQKKMKEAE